MARKHRSQALEADALHLSTDIWSSVVVIVGLIGVKLASANPALAFPHKADAVAALAVAAIVVVVSAQLGWPTIRALLDTTEEGTSEKVQAAVQALEQVRDCHAVRVRHSGQNVARLQVPLE